MIARTSLGDLPRALVEELAAAGLDPRAVHAHVADAFEEDLPGGVDEYLRIEAEAASQRGRAASPMDAQGGAPARERISGAERRQVELEVRSLERRVQKATEQREALLADFAVVDQSDYDRLLAMQRELGEVEERLAELEEAWLEAADRLEG